MTETLERPERGRDTKPNGASEVGFGSEVVMQQRLVDACLIGDVLHPRTVDAAPHKHRVGGVEDARLGVRCGLSRWFNHVVN